MPWLSRILSVTVGIFTAVIGKLGMLVIEEVECRNVILTKALKPSAAHKQNYTQRIIILLIKLCFKWYNLTVIVYWVVRNGHIVLVAGLSNQPKVSVFEGI